MDIAKVDLSIEQSLLEFQERRMSRLEAVAANTLLRRKNPYLFAATGVEAVDDLAKGLYRRVPIFLRRNDLGERIY